LVTVLVTVARIRTGERCNSSLRHRDRESGTSGATGTIPGRSWRCRLPDGSSRYRRCRQAGPPRLGR
jgi:hypothetical protein